ncbi:MAG: hypothetical protein V3R71_02525, partial [Gemmatimonadales bacterium]
MGRFFGALGGPCGRLPIQLFDDVGEAGLIELVFREDDLAVGCYQDTPGNPTIGEGPKQRVVRVVGNDREVELVFLLPGSTGVLTFEGADTDDFETVRLEALKDPSDGRSLLPTTLSQGFPEDDEQSVGTLHREAIIRHPDGSSGLDAVA